MAAATMEDVQARLPEMLDRVRGGEEIIITRDDTPVARIVAEESPRRKPRQKGSAKGLLVVVQEDDEHLEDFKEHME